MVSITELPQDLVTVCLLQCIGINSEYNEKSFPFLILNNISLKSIAAFSRVCKSWNKLLNAEDLSGQIFWRKLFHHFFWKTELAIVSKQLQSIEIPKKNIDEAHHRILNWKEVFHLCHDRITLISFVLRELQLYWMRNNGQRPGQLFHNMHVYDRHSIRRWCIDDLLSHFKYHNQRTFSEYSKNKSNDTSDLHDRLYRMSVEKQFNFQIEDYKKEDPVIAVVSDPSSYINFDCPPRKKVCMMNILTLFGLVWIHPNHIQQTFDELILSIWPAEAPDVPISWNEDIEKVEVRLVARLLDLYWNDPPLFIANFASQYQFQKSTHSNLPIVFINNKSNLPIAGGQVDECSVSPNGLSICEEGQPVKVTWKEPLGEKELKNLEALMQKQFLFVKVCGRKEGNTIEGNLVEMLLVPKDRFQPARYGW